MTTDDRKQAESKTVTVTIGGDPAARPNRPTGSMRLASVEPASLERTDESNVGPTRPVWTPPLYQEQSLRSDASEEPPLIAGPSLQQLSRSSQNEPSQSPDPHAQPATPTPASRPTVTPPIDIYENHEGLVLVADLPGAAESDIKVQLDQNVLRLFARTAAVTPPEAQPLHLEFPDADFARTFILSHEIDRDAIRAEWRDGVLRVIMPMLRREATRRIEVKGH
jgi:HSP20 family molecular chaperone IbpA